MRSVLGLSSRPFLGLLAVIGASCAPEPDPPLQPCDIRTPACQREVFLAVQKLRNHTWDPWTHPPPVRIISPLVLQDEIAAETAQLGADSWSPALQGLGLLQAGVDAHAATQRWRTSIAAYYYRWKVTIVDDGSPLDSIWAVATLAHEYVHALQDRESGIFLYGHVPGHTEQEWILRALVEGEAELFDHLVRRRLEGKALFHPDIESTFADRSFALRIEVEAAENRDTTVRNSAPYALGGLVFARAWNSQGAVGPARLWSKPPPRVLFFMDSAQQEPGAFECPAPDPPAGYARVGEDALGALYLHAFLLDSLPEEMAWQAATSWRGDRLWLFEEVSGSSTAAVWRIRAPGIDATALSSTALWRHKREGDELIVVWADDETLRQALLERTYGPCVAAPAR